ncbi:hypothetical protein CENSYa_0486 [Cenarchaeum symbiosum A]|uniref:Uncharacterized protein n=1 Tax=Cenarchaeum symbiosum (strain A) TaxID=414004 RepID=A0RUV3_CENSY|nr:hypothetical protein CENSYa_0486 [Cenarchaeum symbiosum A]
MNSTQNAASSRRRFNGVAPRLCGIKLVGAALHGALRYRASIALRTCAVFAPGHNFPPGTPLCKVWSPGPCD